MDMSNNFTVKRNLNGRDVQNTVYKLQNINSGIYIANIDRQVNAKSIIGVLSLHLQVGDIIRITLLNNNSENPNSVKNDMDKVVKIFENIGVDVM